MRQSKIYIGRYYMVRKRMKAAHGFPPCAPLYRAKLIDKKSDGVVVVEVRRCNVDSKTNHLRFQMKWLNVKASDVMSEAEVQQEADVHRYWIQPVFDLHRPVGDRLAPTGHSFVGQIGI